MGMQDWTFMHIGISVKNMDEAVKWLGSLGATTDDRPAFTLDSRNFKEYTSYGKTDSPPWRIKIKQMKWGPVGIELTEPVDGGNWNETYLKDHGEGINHVAVQVNDLAKEVAEMQAKGVPAMYYAKGQYAYMDARKVGGIVLELFQKREGPPPGPPPARR